MSGSSYDKYLDINGPLKWDEAKDDFSQLILGMACVHAQDILHRDLKPANIMRKKDGRIVIVDFGLSKSTTNDCAIAASMTRSGTFQGTIAYSSPEQHDQELGEVSCASDVFSMAIIFYEAITGGLPFGVGSDSAASQRATVSSLSNSKAQSKFLINLTEKDPVEFTEEEAPPSLNNFLLKCLKKGPGERFKDAGAMKEP